MNGARCFLGLAALACLIGGSVWAQDPGEERAAPVRPRPQPSAEPAPSRNGNTSQNKTLVTEPISFNYDEVPLFNVVEAVAKMTGRNFLYDPNTLQTPVTVVTHEEIPPEMALEFLESLLAAQGFHIIETLDGYLIRVVQDSASDGNDKLPVYTGGKKDVPGFDRLSTHIVPIHYGDAEDLARLLERVGSAAGRVDAYVKTNTLIITDTADGIRNILALLEELDIPGYDTSLEFFRLNYTRAEVLATQIDEVLMGGTGGGAGETGIRRPTPTRAVRPSRRASEETSVVVGSREETLQLVPDERLNVLIVQASDPLMERVRDLVKRLDSPTPIEDQNVHVYDLLYADAEQVETALKELTGATTPRQGGGQQAAAASSEVQPFEKEVVITRFDQTNALLIVASPQDYDRIEELLMRLDVPQRQVYVEATIMQVSINDTYGLEVQSAGLTANDLLALNNTLSLAELLAGGVGLLTSAGGAGTSLGLLDGTVDVTYPDGAGGFVNQTIPNVPLLIKALEYITDTDILSRPSLTTVDNEDASIVVGQEVPFVTGSTRSLNQSAVDSSVYSRVDRQDVGVKMTVSPQISEGDFVMLDLTVEVSSIAAQQVGTVDVLGPTVNKSEIEDRVVIRNGSTAVIGGLMKETRDRSRTQPPILGDVPLIGWLFRNKSNIRQKDNLVVLVTPHVVKQGIDLARLTEHHMRQFEDANIDALFESGFIKRIKKKHQLRTRYSPTRQKTAEILEGEGFTRGDMQR